MEAARGGRNEVAALYLNTALRGSDAAELARKLFVVVDRRLPPRLRELSDRPEGSVANPLEPDREVIGTLTTDSGTLDLTLERVDRGAAGPVWLFARDTLGAVPTAYEEINRISVEPFLPTFLTRPNIGGIRLFQWLVVAFVFLITYQLTGLLGPLLRPLVTAVRRRRGETDSVPFTLAPRFLRLLLLVVVIRWLLSLVALPLRERQFWLVIVALLTIGSLTWGLLSLNVAVERYAYGRLRTRGHGEIAAMLRLIRRFADTLVVAGAFLVTLYYFGFNPTAALAGLGIGGIAIALAAQKTLENVIGGLSIIADKAVRVGDFFKMGETMGTVEYIGLRSTRIRTLDRTLVSVPNGQIANATIETLSARDKFFFNHVVKLGYETTASQMRTVVERLRAHLTAHPAVDRTETIRVRFLRLGPFSLDVEIFAYVHAADWNAFLETQQDLLLGFMEIVDQAGCAIALPSQRLHVTGAGDDAARAAIEEGSGRSIAGARRSLT
jgi:MscS family membrane protein